MELEVRLSACHCSVLFPFVLVEDGAVWRAGEVALPAPGGRDPLHGSAGVALLSQSPMACCGQLGRVPGTGCRGSKGVLRASCPSPKDGLGLAPRDHRLAARKSHRGAVPTAGRAGRWRGQGTSCTFPSRGPPASHAAGLEAEGPSPWRPALPRAPGGRDLTEGRGWQG